MPPWYYGLYDYDVMARKLTYVLMPFHWPMRAFRALRYWWVEHVQDRCPYAWEKASFLEDLRRAAYNAGLAKGIDGGLTKGRSEGYEQGFMAGFEEGKQAYAKALSDAIDGGAA